MPSDPARLAADCYEAWNIQVQGLPQRLRAIGLAKLVIGVSGGLDSTEALVVAAKAMDRLDLPRANMLAYTLPGFATSDATKGNAWTLMRSSASRAEEIDIRPAAEQMLGDLGHPFASGEPVYDVTFENVQAGCAPTTCSASPTSTAPWWSARATCRSWGSAGAPTASATR